MPAHSYGLVPWRRGADGVEVLVGHMGGPFWTRKDEHAWTFPKGLPEPGEEPLATALREYAEELGVPAPDPDVADLVALGEARQSGGKRVTAWAVEVDLDPADVVPGTFEMEWPPRSGRTQSFPEVDRVEWVLPDRARTLLVKGQVGLLDRLLEQLGG
ncbi:DNA mismatch repair protein MutT [Marmoricola endophyticus]|uniref:DNA mismatch repair protein MutT n=1 Tax=Marmoricola endophyticus TaxID=2040280 RepID=A0A917EYY0_9ACTN|nr:NUDIX domain-containing protein [Marmoricola endophyticus]GGF35441.1 DNA mismatch repair protein MutT [Marmoricola endophyticus]